MNIGIVYDGEVRVMIATNREKRLASTGMREIPGVCGEGAAMGCEFPAKSTLRRENTRREADERGRLVPRDSTSETTLATHGSIAATV